MAILGFHEERCIGCGMCARGCSVDVIRMDPETKRPVVVYPQDCMMCEMCISLCPVDAVDFSVRPVTKAPVSWG